jgi:uncharacterized OB-fold protein
MTTLPEGVELPALSRGAGYGPGGGGGLTPENEGHWRAAAEGTFTVPTCDDCGTQRWPIGPVCYACHSMRWHWGPVPGTGVVYTYTWIEGAGRPDQPEQNVAVIELDGVTGDLVRVPGWVVDVARGELVCGMPVEATFEIVADGVGVPHWRPRRPAD